MIYERRNWFSHLLAIQGTVVRSLLPRLVVIVAAAICIHLLAEYKIVRLALPGTFHSLLGTALSLLVAFRTNTAYDRFWEGRKLWGSIVNRTRNLARMVTVELDAPTARRVTLLLAAFVHAAKRNLWNELTTPELARLLGEDEAAQLARPPGAAQRSLMAIGGELERLRREGKLEAVDRQRLEENVSILLDQLGACQRIKRTPIPFAYVVHLHRLLFVYCLTLPCVLLDQTDWRDVVIVALVSYGLLGIEQIGVEIEDPFEHTPNDIDLESISASIERDVLAYTESSTR